MKYLIYISISVLVLLMSFFAYNNYKKDKIATNNLTNKNNMQKGNNLNKAEYKIVAFGDSLTAGYNVDLRDSYPSILQDKLNGNMIKMGKDEQEVNYKIINMGVSGETTTGGLERVDFVISQNPSLILLGLGANDMLRTTNPAITKNNLENIIEKLQSKNIPIILLGMQSQVSNGSDYKKDFDAIYSDLAKKYKINYVPFFLEGVVLVSNLNTSDGIHPNRMGYEKIVSENILPILLPFLKGL